MPYHFETIKAQMASDIVAVLQQYPGSPPKVKFGRPRKPLRSYPHAVVRTVVDREIEGRSVEESYGFEISLRLPLPSDEIDIESHVLGAAERLIGKLAPCAPDAVPLPQGDYAGVGYLPQVTAVKPGEDEDADPFCSVLVGFGLRATVYQ